MMRHVGSTAHMARRFSHERMDADRGYGGGVSRLAHSVIVLFLLMSATQCSSSPSGVDNGHTLANGGEGVDSFPFKGLGPHPEEPIDVWTYAPPGELSDKRILVVMPGSQRNAEEYRDEWLDAARTHDVLLLVPEFPEREFSTEEYNLGNVVDESGDPLTESEWTFSAVEGLVSQVRNEIDSTETGYYLYGHSAGAQFVHRMMILLEENSVISAVSANAGWYTVPDPEVDFPYGLRDGPTTEDGLDRMVGAPLTIMLGADDDDPDAEGLRSDDGSDRQGSTRLERGLNFYMEGRRAASEVNESFAWDLRVVAGVGHSNSEMAEPSADALFE